MPLGVGQIKVTLYTKLSIVWFILAFILSRSMMLSRLDDADLRLLSVDEHVKPVWKIGNSCRRPAWSQVAAYPEAFFPVQLHSGMYELTLAHLGRFVELKRKKLCDSGTLKIFHKPPIKLIRYT